MRRSLRRVSRGHRLVGQQSGRRRGIERAPAGRFLRQGFGRFPRPDGVAAAIWRCGGRYGPESGMSSPPAPVSIIEEGREASAPGFSGELVELLAGPRAIIPVVFLASGGQKVSYT